MKQIRVVYSNEPSFPATDQHTNAVRYRVGSYWVDAIGGEPTEEEVLTVLGIVSPSQALVNYATGKRWLVETGGINMSGIPVPTNDRAKLLILGAATSMPPGSSAPMVIAGVNYGILTDEQFKAINVAVIAHVQKTFQTLASVLDGIAADTVTTTDQIDVAFK